MNPEIKAEWVAALRSGDYKQGDSYLAQVDSVRGVRHCCLGVLCELATVAGVVGREEAQGGQGRRVIDFDKHASFLPPSVVQWAGLNRESPMVPTGATEEYDDAEVSLAALNDARLSFDKIAELIEAHL